MGKLETLKILSTKGYLIPEVFAQIDNLREWLRSDTQLKEVYAKIGPRPVILRSNAVDEDAALSLAGVHLSTAVPSDSFEIFQLSLNSLSDLHDNQRYFLQELKTFSRSGVIFSRNPHNLWNTEGWIEIGAKAEQVTSGQGSTQTVPFHSAEASEFTELIEMSRQIETLLDQPADIEWGQNQEGFWLLQARPLQSHGQPLSFYKRRWTRKLAEERFPLAMTPLGWDLLENAMPLNLQTLEREMGLRTAKDLPTALFQNYAYVDPEYFQFQKIKLSWSWLFFSGAWYRILFFLLKSPWFVLKKKPLSLELVKTLYQKTAQNLIGRWTLIIRETRRELHHLQSEIENGSFGKTEFFRLEECCLRFFSDDILVFALKTAYYESMKSRLSAERLTSLLARVPHPRKQMLEEFARYRKNPSPETQEQLLKSYGHLRWDWDISRRSLAENPERFSLLVEQAEEAKPSRQGPEPSSDEKTLLDLIAIDEEMQFYSSEFLQTCKLFLQRQAQQMNIDSAEIFFFRLTEIREWLDSGARPQSLVLAARKKRFTHALTLRPSENLPPQEVPIKNSAAAAYVPVSQGSAEGPLYVLKSLEDLSSVPLGCVLFSPSPHPLLIHVFSRINGLICEHGGPLSHGFISAREFALPAITSSQVFSSGDNGKKIFIQSETGRVQWL